MKKNLLMVLYLLLTLSLMAQTFPFGDANHSGTVDIVDALTIARTYVNMPVENYYPEEADVNCLDGVNIVDALLIAQYYVKLIDDFPCKPETPTPTLTPVPEETADPNAISGLPTPQTSGIAKPNGNPGNMVILNWAGFKGAVSYTFDDANSSQINNYSRLNALDVNFTFYLWTSRSEASNNIWAQAVRDGHELGNHTQSHQQNASGSDADAATNFIKQKFGVTPYTMAAPYGDTSWASVAQSRFILNRGVNGGSIAPNDNSNAFNLPCYLPPSNASASAMNNMTDSARSQGKWQIFCIHGFTGGSDGAYQPIGLDQFEQTVTHVKSQGDMWIDSAENVGAYWLGQKSVSRVSPSRSGDDLVYNWTLPANFPPKKYLRVKFDGGTPYQNGSPLAWSANGYYEISLDAKTLTLKP
ncbi:MAG: polysaccharide deacetylase family protein [Spirochaetales bacterium]|nr:polysaccharide deacetylase family protein [Spirochaetales bacterium]